ncbi:DUF1289 domain-containing protein [Ancylobacter sp. MQZ15Z-1]|uniref:DUF1289 domain-containing protein n=1 Tax=Ancylobacter mangrovi TaxID=2972472 RepID=A0A9X2T5I8_9HYPH|nr:DUF1289 domain-containing protein [Ancylobacter mangrovi]MCS0493943.1 DUF1289 domain-containing protein [Ancylobacter mangrovi]
MPTTVSTPCVATCTLDAGGRICIGCGRTIEEIGAWSRMSESERRAVMARLAASRAADAAATARAPARPARMREGAR